jgi:hypothetical protein
VIRWQSGIIRAFITAGVSLAAPHVVRAHDIHTTLATITTTAGGTQVVIRSFADDFSATVARFRGRPAPADSSVSEHDAEAYSRATLRVVNAAGAVVLPTSCGLRRERDVYLLCLRLPQSADIRGWRVQSSMLTELHADQVNIVQVVRDGRRRTVLCTKGSAMQVLVP